MRWLSFPLLTDDNDDAGSDDFDMTDARQGHALAVESVAPELADLRIAHCPNHISGGCFWKIYFVLLHPKLRKEDAVLLSTPQHVGPVLIFCSEDDELAPCSIVQKNSQRLLLLGGDVNLVKWHSSPHVGHYKHHPEEYRAAVAELLIKASTLYISRRQLNGYEVGTSEPNGMPQSIYNLHKSAASSNDGLRRVPTDPTDRFFLPSSMEYHESSNEEPKPELFNMPSVESMNPHGVLGQMLYDVCVPKNVEGWDFKPSVSVNGRHIHKHTMTRRHGTFNPIKCIRRSRL